jgi:hypothetical protein
VTSSTARGLAAALACVMSGACAARGDHKSYVLPVLEIVAMDAGINRVGSLILEPETFRVTPDSIRSNLRDSWVVDDDPFQINQFGHPYQGAMYHAIARSNGLNYWTSSIYTFAGSALWEIAGETTRPSANDQIASGIAGSFLGEPLFRISRLLVDRADNGPGGWRTLGSLLASPPTGFNHLLVGRPAGSPAPDEVPFSDIRVQFGVTAIPSDNSQTKYSLAVDQPRIALSMDYGHPGTPGYRHERPFDYFRIESSVSNEGLEQVSTRGLLAGADYGSGRHGGIWGLYGTYDYFSPDDFRFSSTAAAFGTTLQAPLAGPVVLQTTGLAGLGYVATHTEGQPDDFHYGVAPQALVNLRLIGGSRAAMDLTAREYVVSDIGGFGDGIGTIQRDLIFVGDASIAFRIVGRHGLALTYQRAGRNSDYLQLPDQSRSRTTVGLFYTFLGAGGFGAVR